jgi:hypothetical protein
MHWLGCQYPYGHMPINEPVNEPSHPYARSNSSMARSGQSKISMKSAVKEVLGGGGNDHDQWKDADIFVSLTGLFFYRQPKHTAQLSMGSNSIPDMVAGEKDLDVDPWKILLCISLRPTTL